MTDKSPQRFRELSEAEILFPVISYSWAKDSLFLFSLASQENIVAETNLK
jgi:hypothetical protein